jgi:hypothetical protein
MPPHLGQAMICPIAAALFTLSRDLQVVHWMEKASTNGSRWARRRASISLRNVAIDLQF